MSGRGRCRGAGTSVDPNHWLLIHGSSAAGQLTDWRGGLGGRGCKVPRRGHGMGGRRHRTPIIAREDQKTSIRRRPPAVRDSDGIPQGTKGREFTGLHACSAHLEAGLVELGEVPWSESWLMMSDHDRPAESWRLASYMKMAPFYTSERAVPSCAATVPGSRPSWGKP